MNSTQTSQPPKPYVAVKIHVEGELPKFLPDGNAIAASLLYRLAQSRLPSTKRLDVFSGFLNDSFYAFEVASLPESLACLEAILTETNLRGFATILFFDHREGFFRPHGPDNAAIGNKFTFDNMRAAVDTVFFEQVAAVKAAFNPPKPDGPKPPDQP